MGKYIEQNLGRNEAVVKNAEMNPLFLLAAWLGGILFFWMLLIPTVKAAIKTAVFFNTELAFTNKRIVGKIGVVNTKSLDAPLNKVQNVSVSSDLFGKIFNYSTVCITTAGGNLNFAGIKNGDAFKGMLMEQIDKFEEDRVREQAQQMASAVSGAIRS